MRILLIEDDSETASFIAENLSAAGHEVICADNGLDGLREIGASAPDFIIVDRMIPKLSGLAVIKAIRADNIDTPVIFLTAMNTIADRVEGLEAGGDDYLVKPFAMEELIARINALTRRPSNSNNETQIKIDDLLVDRLSRQVSRRGQAIQLQPREYQILEFLLAHAGQTVTRKMLLESIWDFQFDPGTNIVESHISRLRSKIDIKGSKPLIKTIRGTGYILING